MLAPARARRPGAVRPALAPPTDEELDACPFCGGREDRTPPETLRLPAGGVGWSVRVVPNLYPALERQEVVVHTPRHVRSFAELEMDEIDLVAEAWQRRAAAEPAPYVQALLNEGREAGASLPHTHSQLAWLPERPPAVAVERGPGVVAKVVERDGLVLGCPVASRVPYELQVAPASPESQAFGSDLLAPALRLLADGIRRVTAIVGQAPLNAWLHDGPHWHLELFPRLTVLAGLELGAGIYVNTVDPGEAAAALRSV